MLQVPPWASLFPYTTLFRSLPLRWLRQPPADCWPEGERTPSEVEQFEATPGSEAHTAELQSRPPQLWRTSLDTRDTLSACSVGAVVSELLWTSKVGKLAFARSVWL